MGATPAAALGEAVLRLQRRRPVAAVAAAAAGRPSAPGSWLRTELAGRLGVTLLLIVLARVGHFVPLPGFAGGRLWRRNAEPSRVQLPVCPTPARGGCRTLLLICHLSPPLAGAVGSAAEGQAAMELLMGRSEVAANVFVLG